MASQDLPCAPSEDEFRVPQAYFSSLERLRYQIGACGNLAADRGIGPQDLDGAQDESRAMFDRVHQSLIEQRGTDLESIEILGLLQEIHAEDSQVLERAQSFRNVSNERAAMGNLKYAWGREAAVNLSLTNLSSIEGAPCTTEAVDFLRDEVRRLWGDWLREAERWRDSNEYFTIEVNRLYSFEQNLIDQALDLGSPEGLQWTRQWMTFELAYWRAHEEAQLPTPQEALFLIFSHRENSTSLGVDYVLETIWRDIHVDLERAASGGSYYYEIHPATALRAIALEALRFEATAWSCGSQ